MRLTLLAASVFAAACAMPIPVPPAPLVAFNPEEVRWAAQPGTSTIEGQAFLKTRGGDVKYGAGSLVLLIPYSAQSLAWYKERIATLRHIPPMDPALQALVKATTAGRDGSFRFENEPAGSYLVVTLVMWEPAATYADTQGGYIGMPVTAEAGKTARIIVTR